MKFALLLIAQSLLAHELADNRATLVLRDKTHLTVTVYVDYVEALRASLAPDRPLLEFLVTYSAMDRAMLGKKLAETQTRFEGATRICVAKDHTAKISRWVWPTAAEVQTLLRQYAMEAIADPVGHAHAKLLEVRVEADSATEIATVQAQFPAEFGRVLVVAYKPQQAWADTSKLSAEIRF